VFGPPCREPRQHGPSRPSSNLSSMAVCRSTPVTVSPPVPSTSRCLEDARNANDTGRYRDRGRLRAAAERRIVEAVQRILGQVLAVVGDESSARRRGFRWR
jgi:hypothetical protein